MQLDENTNSQCKHESMLNFYSKWFKSPEYLGDFLSWSYDFNKQK